MPDDVHIVVLAAGMGTRLKSARPKVLHRVAGTPMISHVLERARAANVALIGIGNARDDSAVVRMGCFSVAEMRRLRDRGVVGDILGSFFDADGHAVVDGIGDRVVAIGRADLERITCVVGICSERDKGDAVLGALRTGMVNVLVTNLSTARTVLELSGRS